MSAVRTQLVIFSAVGIGFAAVVIWNFYWPVNGTFDVTGYPLGRETPQNFSGDGISGVLWRNTTDETFVEWQMDGGPSPRARSPPIRRRHHAAVILAGVH